MISGIISLFGAFFIGQALFLEADDGTAVILSLGAAPMLLAMVLYLIFLIFPGLSPATVGMSMAVLFGGSGAVFLVRNRKKIFHFSAPFLFVPLLISLPAFFFVSHHVSSFDPINYAFIGKTFLSRMSVRGYPFISPGHIGGVFSWFAHPPMFSLMQTWLRLAGLDAFVRFIGVFYYMLTNLLIFRVIRKQKGLGIAVSFTLVLAMTPFFIRTSVEGFTTPIRMFFFTGTAVLLAFSKERKIWPAGIFAGMAMLSHTIGLLAVPGGILALIIVDRGVKWKRLILFGVIAGLIGGLPYLLIFRKFHSLATTGVFVGAFGKKLVDDVFRYQFIQKGMPTFASRLMYGYFSPVFRFSSYGPAFILGFAALAFSGLRRIPRNRIRDAALGFLLVYFTLHFLPLHHNIFILSPRYPLTVLPLLILAGAVSLPEKPAWKYAAGAAAVISGGMILCFAPPFYRQPCLQCEMSRYINTHLTKQDRVLVCRSPFFFLDIRNIPGVDAMEPALAPLYREPDLNTILHKLKKTGITYVLLPYAPTPFESEGFVRRLIETPGILEGVKHTPAFHLFRIHYPETRLKNPEPVKLLFWSPEKPALTLTAYDHSRKHHPLRFWYNGAGLNIFASFTDTKLALARDIPWRKHAPYIETKGCGFMKISVRFHSATFPFRLCWDIFQFNSGGKLLRVTHPRPVVVSPGWKTLVMPTDYPRMLSSRLPLDSRTAKIVLSFSFYSESGGACVNAIDITGYR
ncbi:MAG: hypothetical protein GXO69_01315 [Acidobacteria bacterium]|nr:hypothetical protein [Acidobacteriota bacterium]